MALLPPRYTLSGCFLLVIGIYACARVPEIFDAAVYSRLGAVSGHTVKHILAAIALIPLFVMLRYRKKTGDGQ